MEICRPDIKEIITMKKYKKINDDEVEVSETVVSRRKLSDVNREIKMIREQIIKITSRLNRLKAEKSEIEKVINS